MAHDCHCKHGSPVARTEDHAPVHAQQTVGEVASRRAGALEIMKELGINHCCGAHLTLSEAAAAAGVPLTVLLAALNRLDGAAA